VHPHPCSWVPPPPPPGNWKGVHVWCCYRWLCLLSGYPLGPRPCCVGGRPPPVEVGSHRRAGFTFKAFLLRRPGLPTLRGSRLSDGGRVSRTPAPPVLRGAGSRGSRGYGLPGPGPERRTGNFPSLCTRWIVVGSGRCAHIRPAIYLLEKFTSLFTALTALNIACKYR